MKRSKKGLFQIIFSRTVIFVTMLLAQILFLILLSTWIGTSLVEIYGITNIFAWLLIILINSKDENPSFKLAWIFPIVTLPIFGTLLYIFIKSQPGSRVTNKRINDIIKKTENNLSQDDLVLNDIRLKDKNFAGLVQYLADYAKYPTHDNNDINYYPAGEILFKDLLEDLKDAKDFIFLEYFIVSEGVMWDQILQILVKKVEEGVDVRVMYDGLCSLFYLPYGYPKFLRSLGIKTKVFAPLRPFLTTKQNNRDHRKIIVVDGKVAYTGGINMADEYINKKKRFGYWKDNGIRIKGKAVSNFTHMFLQLWNIDEEKCEDFDRYCKVYESFVSANEGYVCGYGDSPLDNEFVGSQVYLSIINNSNDYVYIMTPYLIIDYEMEQALCLASKKGVDVKVVLPGIPDKKYAYCLARTHYEKLLECGVEILEYCPGFVHSKMIISDDKIFVVGSINFDYRSFYLHFECAAIVYGSNEIEKCKKDFFDSMEESHIVTMEECKNRNVFYKMAGALLKVVAPLM